MEFMKASLIDNKTLRLGRSHRNIHEFKGVRVNSIPISQKSSLVKRSSLVKEHPELIDACRNYSLPPVFAYCLGQQNAVEGVSSGRRAFYSPQEKCVLNLKNLGWSKTDLYQEFVVESKGTGIRVKNSEQISKDNIINFIKRHKIYGIENRNLSDELIFSRNEYMHFDVPEGAQDDWGAHTSLEASEHFLKSGFKIAPVICTIKYPSKVQKLVLEFDTERAIVDLKLAQEKRLMPSFVRPAYFEHNGDRNPEIVRLISDDENVLKSLSDVMLEDIVNYFESVAKTTKRKGSKYHWDCIGNMDRVFDSPENMLEKSYAWYLAKDLVLAGTGLYFVDLEGSLVDQCASSRKDLRCQHKIYLTALFKDFFRLMAHYNVAVKSADNLEENKRIELESREKIVERLNKSDFLKVDSHPDSIQVSLNYESIRPEIYKISKERLPMIVGGL